MGIRLDHRMNDRRAASLLILARRLPVGPTLKGENMNKQAELVRFVQCALQIRNEIERRIHSSDPDSPERYELHDIVFPQSEDVTKRPLNRVIGELRQAGELELLSPLVVALDKAIRDDLKWFVEQPRFEHGEILTREISSAVNAILPYIEDEKDKSSGPGIPPPLPASPLKDPIKVANIPRGKWANKHLYRKLKSLDCRMEKRGSRWWVERQDAIQYAPNARLKERIEALDKE